jgi:hypothetical protein
MSAHAGVDERGEVWSIVAQADEIVIAAFCDRRLPT